MVYAWCVILLCDSHLPHPFIPVKCSELCQYSSSS